MAEYPEAIDYYVDRSRVFVGRNSHSAIVLHGTGGAATQTAQQLGDYFRTSSGWTSSHFGIDRAGVVAQYVQLADGAAANCCPEFDHDPFWNQFGGDNLNIHTISIECVNDASNSLPLTEPQKQSLFKLVAWLCDKYGLGASQVKTHQSIAPGSRARCPGSAYPLNELIAFLNSGGNTMQSYGPGQGDFDQYFTPDNDGNWTCERFNTVLLGGNKGLYSQLSIDGNALPIIGLPRTNELYQHETDGYSWSVQFFERGLIVYDPGHVMDGQPGMGSSYLGKYLQFQQYDPEGKTVVVEKTTDEVRTRIHTIADNVAVLVRIADSSSSLNS
jgi:N-acetylmuramoyl-L-alanine amidase